MSTINDGPGEGGEGRRADGVPRGLPAADLHRRSDLAGLDFETTDDLTASDGAVGQERATRALSFGVAIQREGFHVYALGPDETRKREIVDRFLRERAAEGPVPKDLCYVKDFENPHRPRALSLPPGRGRALAHDLDAFLERLTPALRAALESEEHQARRQGVAEEAGEAQQESFETLRQRAKDRGLALLRTPAGFVFAPLQDGEVLEPAQVEELPEEEREGLQSAAQELQQELQQILRRVPRQRREVEERMRALDREVANLTVRDHLEEIREKYVDLPQVRAFLDRIQEDIVEHVNEIVDEEEPAGPGRVRISPGGGFGGPLDRPEIRRYRVNVVVDHGGSEHAPVVHEDHPTYQNLIGRLEYLPVMGALVTDFNLIKGGALHRASGGYLLLDAHRVLMQPLAWEGLKRTLQLRELRLESAQEAMGLASTVTLEPEPLPLDVKVVLLGSRYLYHLLSAFDPDFARLFKVAVDFDEEMPRSGDGEEVYARFLAGMVQEEGLRPFHRTALERVMEWGARTIADSEKLSARVEEILDLMREADHWCGEEGADLVSAEHVGRAVDEWTYRSARIRDRIQEEIRRETILIDTDGTVPGQVNGLAVLQMGGFSFGRPNRITARVRIGKGEVIDIEREVELSGPIHSKGVLILSSFLAARYAADRPLSLTASLVFEQSYAGVEGDSASAAELFALLSAIGQIPLDQSVAVTGSVNQHGQVQAIGGVNEKIEGFFDVCRDRGLTGRQGVVIPRANVKHLMLRREVVDAVERGEFHVWPVSRVDEGMEILSGLPMGERDEEGDYPEGSVNRRVDDRLTEFALRHREFYGPEQEEGA